MARRWLCALPLVIVLLAPMVATGATPKGHRRIPKTDRAVEEAANTGVGTKRVIIRTTTGQRGFGANALRRKGHRIRAEHAMVDAVSLDLPVNQIERYSRERWRRSVSPET